MTHATTFKTAGGAPRSLVRENSEILSIMEGFSPSEWEMYAQKGGGIPAGLSRMSRAMYEAARDRVSRALVAEGQALRNSVKRKVVYSFGAVLPADSTFDGMSATRPVVLMLEAA